MSKLKNKVAVITGGNSGIGEGDIGEIWKDRYRGSQRGVRQPAPHWAPLRTSARPITTRPWTLTSRASTSPFIKRCPT